MGKDRVAPESHYVVSDETKNRRDDVDAVHDVDAIENETETEIRASNQNSEDDPGEHDVSPNEDEPLPPMRNQADVER